MKNIFTIYLILGFGLLSLKAMIITVDNNYPSIGDYTTIQAAHDAASDGDTIYLTPSDFIYQAITISKKLNIFGCGWENINGLKTARVTGTIILSAGSDQSKISGLNSYYNTLNIKIDANDIIIERNKIRSIEVVTNHSGTIIKHNLIVGITIGINNWSLVLINSGNYAEICNNIMLNETSGWGSTYTITGYSSNLLIKNNIISSYHNSCSSAWKAISLSGVDGLVANNIILNGWITLTDFTFNNILSCDTWTGNGNLAGINLNDVFIDWLNGNYHLKLDSPASGSGLDGTDMGVYGGDFPFVDGGYPAIPLIYYLNVPATGSQQDGVNVMIKARTNN